MIAQQVLIDGGAPAPKPPRRKPSDGWVWRTLWKLPFGQVKARPHEFCQKVPGEDRWSRRDGSYGESLQSLNRQGYWNSPEEALAIKIAETEVEIRQHWASAEYHERCAKREEKRLARLQAAEAQTQP